jgi:excinuclease UvrABC nuclease subunit
MGNLENTSERIKAVKSAFSILGYDVTSDPIEGAEEAFLAEISQVYIKTENFYRKILKKNRYTMFSDRSLADLHKQFPEPAWGIEVRHASEKEALEQKIARAKVDLEQAIEERDSAQRRIDEARSAFHVAERALLNFEVNATAAAITARANGIERKN